MEKAGIKMRIFQLFSNKASDGEGKNRHMESNSVLQHGSISLNRGYSVSSGIL
jgi:hypothetical protein